MVTLTTKSEGIKDVKNNRGTTDMKRINDIETNVNVSRNNNYNDNESKYDKSKAVEAIADRLMDKLPATPKSRPFFCKVAYKLPEAKIWANCEVALSPKSKNPMGLFIFLCKRDGV